MQPVDVDNKYRVFRDNYGVVNAINRIPDGSALFFDPVSREFDEEDPLVVELREWERERGEALDISDFPPDPELEPTPPDDGSGSEDLIL